VLAHTVLAGQVGRVVQLMWSCRAVSPIVE